MASLRGGLSGWRVAFAVLLLWLASALVTSANATEIYTTYQQTAYNNCKIFMDSKPGPYTANGGVLSLCTSKGTIPNAYFEAKFKAGNGGSHWDRYWYTTLSCVSPNVWSDDTHGCFNPNARCEGFRDAGASTHDEITMGGAGPFCLNSCSFGLVGSDLGDEIRKGDGSLIGVRGDFNFTGVSCTVTTQTTPVPALPAVTVKPTAEAVPPICINSAPNPSYCIRSTGQHCQAASTGKQICWGGTETGTKTDGDIAQRRCAGAGPCSPPVLPDGQTPTQVGGANTTTITNNNTSTTSTTTTVNYTTPFGTDAGSANQGEAAGGNVSPETGGVAPGTVSGGGDCAQPYVVSGGDPIANRALSEAFKTRCATEKAVGGTVEGGTADCVTAPTVTGGDLVAAAALKEAWQARCGDGPKWGKVGDGDIASVEENASDADKGKVKGVVMGMSLLDDSGLWGPQSCPTLGTIDLGWAGLVDLDGEGWFCDFVILVHGIFLLLGAWVAFRVLAGGD